MHQKELTLLYYLFKFLVFYRIWYNLVNGYYLISEITIEFYYIITSSNEIWLTSCLKPLAASLLQPGLSNEWILGKTNIIFCKTAMRVVQQNQVWKQILYSQLSYSEWKFNQKLVLIILPSLYSFTSFTRFIRLVCMCVSSCEPTII